MEQEPRPQSASETMTFGLMEYADRMSGSIESTHTLLTEQIDQLRQLQQWTIASVQALQKRAEGTLQGMEAERVRLQGTQLILERNAVQAIHDAVEKQSDKINQQVERSMAGTLHEIRQAGAQVGQNVRESKLLLSAAVFFGGLALGLFAAYFYIIRTQNTMDDRLDRIEQFLSAPAQPPAAAPDLHPSARRGNAK